MVFSLASPARFERAAFRLGGERSILLSYGDRYAFFAAAVNARGKRNYTEATLWLSTKVETNSAQRAATASRSGP